MTVIACTSSSTPVHHGIGHLHYDQNDPTLQNRGELRAWTEKEDASTALIDEPGGRVFTLNSPSTANHWLTPIVELSPILITTATVIEFDIRCPVPGVYKINLTNQEEDAWYNLHYRTEANQWTTVRQYIANASFGRNFRKGHVINDGMLGDNLIRAQIEARGETTALRNFRIYEATQKQVELPPPPSLDTGDYVRTAYPQFGQDGFFPFGVIMTMKAGITRNAGHLGQDPKDRLEMALLDIRRHHFNTVCNFVDDSLDVAGRLKLMEQYQLHLFETVTAYLEQLDQHQAIVEMMNRYTDHPLLLGWYGKDEPRDLQRYLEAKKLAARHAPHKPFTSAFDVPFVIRSLGPHMEIVMTDLYPLTPQVTDPAKAMIDRTAGQIRFASSFGAKVWSINQAFSLRRNGDQIFLRYPTAVEMRFDFFNSLAAGAEGLFYFIYNDEVPYLDGKFRTEEFDDTLVDAWFNASPAYEELARLGQTWLAVLPSTLGATEVDAYAHDPAQHTVLRSMKNGHGHWWVLVNSDLSQARRVSLPSANDGEALYDLQAMAPMVEDGLLLQPGEGVIVVSTDSHRWAKLAAEITQRRTQARLQALQVEQRVLKRAGISIDALDALALLHVDEGWRHDGLDALVSQAEDAILAFRASSHPWVAIGHALDEARVACGQINRHWITIERTPQNAGESSSLDESRLAEIRAVSEKYFQYHSRWKKGDTTLELQQVKSLAREIMELERAEP